MPFQMLAKQDDWLGLRMSTWPYLFHPQQNTFPSSSRNKSKKSPFIVTWNACPNIILRACIWFASLKHVIWMNHQNGEEVIINLFWKSATFDIRNYPFHQFNLMNTKLHYFLPPPTVTPSHSPLTIFQLVWFLISYFVRFYKTK